MDNATVSTVTDNQKLYCYCQGPEEGSMVGCDNSDCKYEWFHFSCLKLSTVPKRSGTALIVATISETKRQE